MTASVTRLLQQSEFDTKAILGQKLEEEKEYVVGEIKSMEANNIDFRMQCHAKLDSMESSLIDRVTTVDRKCYTAPQQEKKYLLDFEAKTRENLQKFQHAEENLRTKFQIGVEGKLNDQKTMLAKVGAIWKGLGG